LKYLIKVCYDGTGYAGFQFQKNAVTVQGVLTDAANKLFDRPVAVTGCSRTDAGVHAKSFMATLAACDETELKLAPEKVPGGMNFYLPEDVSVLECTTVSDDFHPRYSVICKTYEYLIVNSRYRNPLMLHRAYMPGREVSPDDISRMNTAAALLTGRHDFSSYMSAGSSVTDTVRNVMDCHVTEENGIIRICITADGFLYNMVRIISGTLYAVACGKFAPEEIVNITDSRDRHKAGETLPPDGLYLAEVRYPEK